MMRSLLKQTDVESKRYLKLHVFLQLKVFVESTVKHVHDYIALFEVRICLFQWK